MSAPYGANHIGNITPNRSLFSLIHAGAHHDIFFFLHIGEGKAAYDVLRAGVLLEILPPLTRCHTGAPSPPSPPCYHVTVE